MMRKRSRRGRSRKRKTNRKKKRTRTRRTRRIQRKRTRWQEERKARGGEEEQERTERLSGRAPREARGIIDAQSVVRFGHIRLFGLQSAPNGPRGPHDRPKTAPEGARRPKNARRRPETLRTSSQEYLPEVEAHKKRPTTSRTPQTPALSAVRTCTPRSERNYQLLW